MTLSCHWRLLQKVLLSATTKLQATVQPALHCPQDGSEGQHTCAIHFLGMSEPTWLIGEERRQTCHTESFCVTYPTIYDYRCVSAPGSFRFYSMTAATVGSTDAWS